MTTGFVGVKKKEPTIDWKLKNATKKWTRNYAPRWRHETSAVKCDGFRALPTFSRFSPETTLLAGLKKKKIRFNIQDEATNRRRDENYVWEAFEIVSGLGGGHVSCAY